VAERAGDFPIVAGVLLVYGRFDGRLYVALYAVLTERMEAGEAFRGLVRFVAQLADQEFVVDLASESSS